MSTATLEKPTSSQPPTPPLPESLAALTENGGATRTVLRMAWPAIVENALHTLLGVVDTILVARLGTEAIAGVGAGVQWVFLFFSVLFGLSVGAVVLVARAIGAGDHAAASRAARQSLLLSVGIGLGFTVLATLFAEPAVALLGAEPSVVAIGASFLRICSLCAVPMAVSIIGGSALRAAGDTRTPMLATVVANAVNAVVAYLLIFGGLGLPALGADGSAWGMVVARVVGGAILLAVLLRGVGGLTIAGGGWRPDLDILRRLVSFGMPGMIEQILLMGSFMVFSRVSMELGTVAFAAQRITWNAIMISFLPAFGFAIAASTLTGQALGARRPDLAERTAWVAVRSAALWMGAMSVVFLLFPEALLRVFTAEPELIEIGIPSLRVIAFATPLLAVPMVLSGALRGAGDTRFPMVLTTVCSWLVRTPIGFLLALPLGLGLPGAYAGLLADAVVGGLLTVWRFRRGAWREVKV